MEVKSPSVLHCSEVGVHINSFTTEFMVGTLPSLYLDTSIAANRSFSLKSVTEWQTVSILMRWLVRAVPSDLHCFQKYLITKTRTGVHRGIHYFSYFAKNIDCGHSLEPPRRGGSNEYLQSMFWAGIWRISEFFIWIFFLFWLLNFQYIWIGVFP